MAQASADILDILELFRNYDPNPGCRLDDPSKVDEILERTSKSIKSAESLLFTLPPVKEITVENSKKEEDESETPDLPFLLFQENNATEKKEDPVPELKSFLNDIPDFISPIDIDKDELGLTKIQYNSMKMKYMTAQNEILKMYIKYAKVLLDAEAPAKRDVFPTPAKSIPLLTEFMHTEYTQQIKSISGDIGDVRAFLNDLSCSFQEINFLTTILKKYESSMSSS